MNENQNKQNQPAIRGFQLDSSAVGDITKSVNMYRGDMNLPLKLVHLPGPNGLNVDVSAFYASNIGQQADTWNREAPTSILGLGWSLPFDYISFNGNGTANWLEGKFYLHKGGNPYELVQVGKTGDGPDQVLQFALADFPLWEICFQPNKDIWEIKQDNGIVMGFGDPGSNRDTIQWGVRWDNWVGSSVQDTDSTRQFSVAWNLSTIKNQWGNTITYEYANDDVQLTPSCKYTRASYLQRIIDAVGHQVEFSYCPKDIQEYSPLPHAIAQGKPNGYQDRYETYFLKRIVVRVPLKEGQALPTFSALQNTLQPVSDPNTVYYEVDFESNPMGFDDTGTEVLSNTSKRYLLSVTQIRNGQTLLPSLKFSYDMNGNSASRGRMLSVTYPEGGQGQWNYENQELSGNDIFSLQYTAKCPEDLKYNDVKPRIWFGGDYIVIAWHTQSNLQIQVFSHGGHWTEPHSEPLVINNSNPDNIHFVAEQDFFALFIHGNGNTSDRLHVFQRIPYQFGNWDYKYYEIDLNTGNVVEDETALVAGDNFLAIHVGGTPGLHRFRFNKINRHWTQDNPISGKSGCAKMALAGAGNMLFASFYVDDDSGSYDQVFYLDENCEWNSNQQTYKRPFKWESSCVNSYWRIGAGFSAATYMESPQEAKIKICRWTNDFSDFEYHTLDDGIKTPNTIVRGDTVVNGGNIFRYNGSDWDHDSCGFDPDNDAVAVSGDAVVYAEKNGSFFNPVRCKVYKPSESSWDEQELDKVVYSKKGGAVQRRFPVPG